MAAISVTGTVLSSSGNEARVIGEYVIIKQLGAGAYGMVYKAQHRRTGKAVAIKSINHAKLINKKLEDNLETEIRILQETHHRNIVALYDVLRTENETHLVMEYCDGGEFSALLKSRRRLPEPEARDFLRQIAAALEFMRAHNLIHRDLKPSNILLMNDMKTLKIADFGYARYVDPYGVAETACGTPLYMAPEVFSNEAYNAKVDLWSVGCILYEMVCGKVPFLATTQVLLFKLINETKTLQFPPDVQLSSECQDLLRGLLKKDPLKRMSLEQFFMHSFLDFTSYERENPYDVLTSQNQRKPATSSTQQDRANNVLYAAMNSTLALPASLANQATDETTDAHAAAGSPSDTLLQTTMPSHAPRTGPVAGPTRGADDDFVMVEHEMLANHATVDVLLHAPVVPGPSAMGAGSDAMALLLPLKTGSPTGGSGGTITFTGHPQSPPVPLGQSPTLSSALSRALATTAGLTTVVTLDPGQRLARDVLDGLPPQDTGITAVDETTLMNEIELLARGALVLMDYAEDLLRTGSVSDGRVQTATVTAAATATATDAYMIYLKTLVVFTEAFRKARRFYDMRDHHITQRMQEIIKMLNTKYQECLTHAEVMQKRAKQSNTPAGLSTSSMMRSTNKIYELVVAGAKKFAVDAVVAETGKLASAGRLYNYAMILFEMALWPDDQRPLTQQQREYVMILLRETRDRLTRWQQLQQHQQQIAGPTSSSPPPHSQSPH